VLVDDRRKLRPHILDGIGQMLHYRKMMKQIDQRRFERTYGDNGY